MKLRPCFFPAALCLLASVTFSFGAENPHVKGPKPAHVAMGQEVALTSYLVPGKTTIFDFTSEYCPPCRAIAPRLAQAHARRDDLAVVSVDINRPGVKGIDWKSPVARQYELQSIPHFRVYGPTGKLLAQGDAAREMVENLIK